MSDHEHPIYEPMKLSGSAYFVHVTWPDGFETQVHGFINEAEARAWITSKGPRWREWAPQRASRET